MNVDFSHAVKIKVLAADQMGFNNTCVVIIVLRYLKQSRHLGLQSYFIKITDSFLCLVIFLKEVVFINLL